MKLEAKIYKFLSGFFFAGNMRMQGPPPPYHQTQRSASVPGSMTSPGPGPGSPNGTVGLSMPSPRTASGLNSPADGQRGGYQQQQQRIPSGPSPSSSNHLNTPLDSPNPNNGGGGRSMNPSNPGTPLAGPGPPHVSPGMGNLMSAGQPQPGNYSN